MLARKGLKPLVIRKVNGFKVDCFASRCVPRIGGQSHGNARNDNVESLVEK